MSTVTTPTISYGIGYLDDFSILPATGGSSADPLGSLVEEIAYDDWLHFYGVPNSADDEYRWRRTDDLTSLGIGSTLYNKWRIRVKTEASNPGLAAKVHVEYTDATGEDLILNQFTDNWWKVYSGNLALTGKTIKYIYYYIDDYPNSVASGGQNVNYDFLMLYKGDFPLPNTAYGTSFTPPPRYAKGQAPRITDIIQNLGGDSAVFECSSDLDVGTWKRAGDVFDAQVIDEIAHELCTNDFLWLDTGVEQFKAVVEKPVIRRFSDRTILDLAFTEYSRCDASLYSYIERFGLNL